MGRRRATRRRKQQLTSSCPSPAAMPQHVPGEVVFRDAVTGETGVMRQRRDAIFEFHPQQQQPRPVGEPGRYRRTERDRRQRSRE